MTNLTSAARVSSFMAINPNQAAVLDPIIAGASAFVSRFTGKSFEPTLKQLVLDPPASAEPKLIIRDPLISISELKVDKEVWPETVDFWNGSGYYVEKITSSCTALHAISKTWPSLPRSIMLSYLSGYTDTFQEVIGPDNSVSALLYWLDDVSVHLNGVAATKVASAPAVGQYAVSSAGVYTFNAADQAKTAKITYVCTPADVERAIVDLVAYTFSGRDRVGISSKTLGGQETISYSAAALTPTAAMLLKPFRSVV